MMPHKVEQFGRLLFYVSSNSRPDSFYGKVGGAPVFIRHMVDLEPQVNNDGTINENLPFAICDCEAFTYNVERPCRHIRAVLRYIKPLLEFFSKTSHRTKRSYQLNPNKRYDDTRQAKPKSPKR